MKNVIISFFLLLLFAQSTFSQFDDILKKIPGVGDIFLEKAITTSIKDAYPQALWLGGVDKKISYDQTTGFNLNLGAGYYRYKFNTFCLHAGTYAPTEGSGYLVAPLKGPKAELIKSVLRRYYENPEIAQEDVQMLIWGIEAGQKFSNYDPAFQYRVTPLLKPEEIAMMEVDVKDIAYDLLPQEAKEVLNLYRDLRGKLSDANATYSEIEQLAVKTGIAPLGKGSKKIDAGVWTSIGDGVYMRSFPEGYRKSQVEIYIPAETKIEKDSKGSISLLDDGANSISVEYDESGKLIKQISLKNINTGEQQIIDNGTIDNNDLKKSADEFISLIKKSFGKKRSKNITAGVVKDINQIKAIESYIASSTAGDNAKQLTLNALNNYVSDLEAGSKNKKGGGKNHKTGLSNLSGLVFAPANTSQQRLGNGGPEGGNGNQGDPPNSGDPTLPPEKEEEKDCKVKVYISQVNENELPKPDWVYTVSVTIDIQGTDEKCEAEEIKFNFLNNSKERGRYLNDIDKLDDVENDLKFSDLNQGFTIGEMTASKPLSGKSQTVEAYIVCNDYGAFGRLGATVKVKGVWYTAEADGTPDPFITIPVDLNDNKIADSWEKQNNVYGKPGDWDEDPNPKGQAKNGDGMTNYEEYRGFFVSDGSDGSEHKRMNPMQKEIFVIDESKIFSTASWEAATGIKAYWLLLSHVYGSKGGAEQDQNYKWVNFCRGNAQGSKFAVNLKKIDGTVDPYGYHSDQGVLGYNAGPGPPKNTKITVMFPDRIRNWFLASAESMAATLVKFPNGFVIEGVTYSKKEVQKLIDEIKTPAKLEVLVDFWLNLCILHEVAHACNVPHHGGGDENKTGTGDPKCPTKYRSEYTMVKLDKSIATMMNIIEKEGITPIAIYTGWKFCKSKDNCWKKLDVNDR